MSDTDGRSKLDQLAERARLMCPSANAVVTNNGWVRLSWPPEDGWATLDIDSLGNVYAREEGWIKADATDFAQSIRPQP